MVTQFSYRKSELGRYLCSGSSGVGFNSDSICISCVLVEMNIKRGSMN